MTQGLFISLDGVDGCGKSTQCRLLAESFRRNGKSVTLTKDPGGTELGDRLRELLLHSRNDICAMSEALLFMASRAQLVQVVIRPALEKGDVVICDRYLLSTVVYQGYARKLGAGFVYTLGKAFASGLEPHLTVVLDLPFEEAKKRLPERKDRIERRGLEYFERVRCGFLEEAAERPDEIVVVDATGTIEKVHEDICKVVYS